MSLYRASRRQQSASTVVEAAVVVLLVVLEVVVVVEVVDVVDVVDVVVVVVVATAVFPAASSSLSLLVQSSRSSSLSLQLPFTLHVVRSPSLPSPVSCFSSHAGRAEKKK